MRKKKIGLVLCIILLIYFVGGIIYNLSGTNKQKKNNESNVNIGIQIKDYDYICLEDEIDIYKNEFKILKDNLESDNIDYQEYAKSVAKMFIIDLYNLKSKKNMYDVGGVEFIYPDALENYKLNVENTLYKYMEDINDGKRKQELPEVSKVEITNSEEIEYTIGEEIYNGYKVNIDIIYIKDLEYDKQAEVILVKSDKYLYVVEKN